MSASLFVEAAPQCSVDLKIYWIGAETLMMMFSDAPGQQVQCAGGFGVQHLLVAIDSQWQGFPAGEDALPRRVLVQI